MAQEKTLISVAAEVAALKTVDLCKEATKLVTATDRFNNTLARRAIFKMVLRGEYQALNKASRTLEGDYQVGSFFRNTEGEAICTSIQSANGSDYYCTTLFIPVSFSTSPFNSISGTLDASELRTTISKKACLELERLINHYRGGRFGVLPILLSEKSILGHKNKPNVKKICELLGGLEVSKELGVPSYHGGELLKRITQSLNETNDDDKPLGHVCYIACTRTEKIEFDKGSKLKPAEWSLPIKLLLNAEVHELKSEKDFIKSVNLSMEREFFDLSRAGVFAYAGAPQSYSDLGYGNIVASVIAMVSHITREMVDQPHSCEMTIATPQDLGINITYMIHNKTKTESLGLKAPYNPYNSNFPNLEVKIQKDFINKILGINCSLSGDQ